jgi:hypothetical protein
MLATLLLLPLHAQRFPAFLTMMLSVFHLQTMSLKENPVSINQTFEEDNAVFFWSQASEWGQEVAQLLVCGCLCCCRVFARYSSCSESFLSLHGCFIVRDVQQT